MTRQRRRLAAGLLAIWMVCTLAFVTRQTDRPTENAERAVPVLQTLPPAVNTIMGEAYNTENTHLFHHFGTEGSGTAETDLYRESANNYAKDGGTADPRYALVTTDPARAEKDGGSIILTYDDPDNPGSVREYPVSVRYIDISQPGAKALLTDFEDLKGENTTIFLEGGPFYADDGDSDPGTRSETSRFFDFYDNFSVVGIHTDGNVSIYSQPLKDLGTAAKGYIQGYQVGNAQNVCIENITFDAGGYNMAMQSAGADDPDSAERDSKYYHSFFRVTSLTNTGKGGHSSVDGFLMKNVTLQNLGNNAAPLGASNHTQSKNVALDVSFGRSQMNFEQITFRNVLPAEDCTTVVLSQVSDVNFRDVSFEDCGEGGAYIDYDSTAGEAEYVPARGMGAVFAGELAVVKNGGAVTGSDKIIRCRTLEAGRILLPDSVRYAGSGAVICAYQQPPQEETALYDIRDGSLILRPGEAGTLDTTQLQSALAALHEKRGLSEAVFVKLMANGDGEIPAIDPLCNLWGSPEMPDLPTVPVVMAAVPDLSAAYDSTALVPVTRDFTIVPYTAESGGDPGHVLTEPVTESLIFRNLDFAKNPGYTMHEALEGIDPEAVTPTDPLDGSYYEDTLNYREHSSDTAAARTVLDIDSAAFQNCRFAVLAQNLTTNVMSLPAWNPEKNALVVGTGSSAAVTPGFTVYGVGEGERTPLSAADFTGMGGDTDLYWESSDPSVATVIYENGLLQVAGVSKGSAAIFGKAKDRNNKGEIEKPYTTFSVEVTEKDVLTTEQYTITYHANGAEGSLKALNNPYAAGLTVTLLAPEDQLISRSGELFKGWNTRPDGNGAAYQPGDSIVINANVELYAIWHTPEPAPADPLLPEGSIKLNDDDTTHT